MMPTWLWITIGIFIGVPIGFVILVYWLGSRMFRNF